MQTAPCCRLPLSGCRGAQVLLGSEGRGRQSHLAACRGEPPVSLPQQIFLIARRQHSNFISAGFPVAVVVSLATGGLLVCRGAGTARPGNYTCYHALVNCNHVGRLCAGDHRVITILPPTIRMWHLKEDGRGIR